MFSSSPAVHSTPDQSQSHLPSHTLAAPQNPGRQSSRWLQTKPASSQGTIPLTPRWRLNPGHKTLRFHYSWHKPKGNQLRCKQRHFTLGSDPLCCYTGLRDANKIHIYLTRSPQTPWHNHCSWRNCFSWKHGVMLTSRHGTEATKEEKFHKANNLYVKKKIIKDSEWNS